MIRKNLLVLLLVLLASKMCFGQNGAVDLDVNNVRARINSNGCLFWDLNSTPKYEVPKVADQNSIRKSPIFTNTLWFHAIDSLGDTLMAAEQYRQGGVDFGEGPLPPGSQIGFTPVTGRSIFKFDADDRDPNDPTSLDEDVINWPTHYSHNGNTHRLAPFIDLNKNGIYEPTLGDYPYFRGDQSVYFVYHDMINHGLTKTKPLGVQIITEAHAWSTNDKLNDYVFVRYKIVSQNQNLKHFRVGVFSDFDLGNYSDDFVGTDTSRNMIYVMNGDDDDEGILGYGLNPPAFATVFLNQPLCGSCMGENKWAGNFRIAKQPYEFANMLQGLDMNGDSQEVQYSGATPNTYSNYSFTGDPTQTNSAWTMEADPRFMPGDYRMLGITGKDTIMKGDTFDLWLAFVYSRATSGGAKGSLERLQTDVDELFTKHFTKPQIPANCFVTPKQDTTGSGVGLFPTPAKISSTVYPNPATKQVSIELSNPQAAFTCEIINELGQLFSSQQGMGKITVDCSAMPEGIYYIRLLETENGQTKSHKLVVLRDY